MRGVQHGMAFARVRPGDLAEHVGRGVRAHHAADVSLQTHRQLNRPEAALARCLDLLAKIKPGGLHEPPRRPQLEPARRLERRQGIALEVAFFHGLRVLHHGPRVARQVGTVDDEHAGRAQPRRLLVLVGPAAVVGERLALEEGFVRRGRLIHNDEQHLAFYVHTLEVVPAVLGRIDAVTDKDDRRIDVGRSLPAFVLHHEVGVVGERHGRFACRHEREPGRGLVGVHGVQVDLLEKGAVVTGRLQPVQRKLGPDVLGRQLCPALAGSPPFQEIAGQEPDMGANPLGIDQRRGLLRRLGNAADRGYRRQRPGRRLGKAGRGCQQQGRQGVAGERTRHVAP